MPFFFYTTVMHEWALAESVVQSVREEWENHGTPSLVSVTIVFGELQNIERDIFFTGLSEFLGDLPFSPDIFHIETESVLFACNACGKEWGLESAGNGSGNGLGPAEREAIHFVPESACAYIACPSCESKDFFIKAGRGVSIRAIEMEGT